MPPPLLRQLALTFKLAQVCPPVSRRGRFDLAQTGDSDFGLRPAARERSRQATRLLPGGGETGCHVVGLLMRRLPMSQTKDR
jgi:hypothetical protein